MPCDQEEGMHQEWQSSGTNACDTEQEETQETMPKKAQIAAVALQKVKVCGYACNFL